MSMNWTNTTGKDHGKEIAWSYPTPTSFAELVEAINDDEEKLTAADALKCFKRGASIYYRQMQVVSGPSDKDLDVVAKDLANTDPDRLIAAQTAGFTAMRAVLVERFYEMEDE